jgi:hypothetical protein
MVRRGERSHVPLATNAPQQMASLFDHLVGACEQHRRHGETEGLRALATLGWPSLDRGPFENS